MIYVNDGENKGQHKDSEAGKSGSSQMHTGTWAQKRARLIMPPAISIPAKKGSRRRNNLSLLPTMPLDILFEILGQLLPKDLLNVSRTNKLFHETLRSRHASWLWKNTLKCSGSPDCPSDFSEGRWVALLYGSRCQTCGSRGIRSVEFSLRRRLCTRCKKLNYLKRAKAIAEFPGCRDILPLIPGTTVGVASRRPCLLSKFYWRADIETTMQKITTFDRQIQMRIPGSEAALEVFKQQRMYLIDEISSKIDEYMAWEYDQAEQRRLNIANVSRSRTAAIREKFIELGYQGEDIDNALYSRSEYTSPAALNDRIWARIYPILEPCVQAKQKERTDRDFKNMQAERRGIVWDLYAEFKESTAPQEWTSLPRLADICQFDTFSQHIDAPLDVKVTAATFTNAMAALPAMLAARRAALMADLVLMLREAPWAESWNLPAVDADALALATTVFVCSTNCKGAHSSYIFGGVDALTHQCSKDCELDYDVMLYEAPPPATLSVSEYARDVVEELVKATGREPENVTVMEMDRADVRFGCAEERCARKCLGFDWRRAVVHGIKHFMRGKDATWLVLSQRDTETVKKKEKRDPKWDSCHWVCAHCVTSDLHKQSRIAVRCHLFLVHRIYFPTVPADLFPYEPHVLPFTNTHEINYSDEALIA